MKKNKRFTILHSSNTMRTNKDKYVSDSAHQQKLKYTDEYIGEYIYRKRIE